MLHQVFVEGVVDLQCGDECSCDDSIISIINLLYLALEIIDVVPKSFFRLHLDCKEMFLFFLNSCCEVYWLK